MKEDRSCSNVLLWVVVVAIALLSVGSLLWRGISDDESPERSTTRPQSPVSEPTSNPKPTKIIFPEVTFYVRVSSVGRKERETDEVDVYLSLEVAGVKESFDYDYIRYDSCNNNECTWSFGPIPIDRGTWLYLSAYNDGQVGCEIIVTGERLDAANSYGSFATCSGRAR